MTRPIRIEMYFAGIFGNFSPADSDKRRILWADSARGIGIVLVVLGHAIGGLIGAGLAEERSAYGYVYFLIYTFHMPLFFLISAIFMPARLLNNRRKIVSDSFPRLVWPYLVWGTLQYLIIMSLGNLVNTPHSYDPYRIIEIFWRPPSQFWFLYSLFFFQIFAVVFYTIKIEQYILVSASIAALVSYVIVLPSILDASLKSSVFYALGLYMSPYLLNIDNSSYLSPNRLLLFFILWLMLSSTMYFVNVRMPIVDILVAIIGMTVCLRLSQLLTGVFQTIFIALGRRSMSIFILHVLIVAGVRIVAVKVFGITQASLILTTSAILGIVIPCVIYNWTHKHRISSVLGLG